MSIKPSCGGGHISDRVTRRSGWFFLDVHDNQYPLWSGYARAAFFAKGGGSIALLVFIGIDAFLFCLWMLDVAYSFMKHGLSMQAVTAVMFARAAGDWLAGILAFVGAVFLAIARKREFRAV